MTTLNWTPEKCAPNDRYRVQRSDSVTRRFARSIYPLSDPSLRSYVCTSSFASAADRTELERVWGLTKGAAGTFDWTPPEESTSRTCRFMNQQLTFRQQTSAKLYGVTVEIEEV